MLGVTEDKATLETQVRAQNQLVLIQKSLYKSLICNTNGVGLEYL